MEGLFRVSVLGKQRVSRIVYRVLLDSFSPLVQHSILLCNLCTLARYKQLRNDGDLSKFKINSVHDRSPESLRGCMRVYFQAGSPARSYETSARLRFLRHKTSRLRRSMRLSELFQDRRKRGAHFYLIFILLPA